MGKSWPSLPSHLNLCLSPTLASSGSGSHGLALPGHSRLETLGSCWFHPNWNPHPCGFYGDIKRQCRCSSRQIENYRQRISGPLLDRIDLHVEVPLVDFRELSSNTTGGEKSETIRERVVQARKTQGERFRKSSNMTNSAMNPRQMKAALPDRRRGHRLSGACDGGDELLSPRPRPHPQGRPHPGRSLRIAGNPPVRHPRSHPIPLAGPEVVFVT